MNEFLSRLQDDLEEAMDTVMCSRCKGKRRFEMTVNLREPDTVLSVIHLLRKEAWEIQACWAS